MVLPMRISSQVMMSRVPMPCSQSIASIAVAVKEIVLPIVGDSDQREV
jgi:hypothetical protein